MKIYIGSDHAGFKLKERIKRFFTSRDIRFEDVGNVAFDPADDYPDYAVAVAKKTVASTNGRGIIVCKNGVGVCIAANKVPGARAVTALTPRLAHSAVSDDNANILCLGQGFVSFELARRIITAWLSARFRNASRDRRRLQKIKKIERML